MSNCPGEGWGENCAPTEGDMKGLNGNVIIASDSTLTNKMGECVSNQINRSRRKYGRGLYVDFVGFPGLCMGAECGRDPERATLDAIKALPVGCKIKHARVAWDKSCYVPTIDGKSKSDAEGYNARGHAMEYNKFSGPGNWTEHSHPNCVNLGRVTDLLDR